MLTSICISKLFDLYSYELDLRCQDSKVCFITGPNGYGKTTLLNIIDCIYNGKWEKLCAIPFDHILLTFSDGAILSILQSKVVIQEEESDESISESISLKVDFHLTPEAIYSFEWIKNPAQNFFPDRNIELFFNSHPVYYIRDGRLFSPDRTPTIELCVQAMKEFLRDSYVSETPSFQEKIRIFIEIIKSSDFADKSLQVDQRFGFRFVLNNELKKILSPESLSSGEQHLTVMAFELLFMAPDDSLVLIDEPEISFHMLWQVDFLKKMNLILDARKLQCIVATHSPQIFNMKWGLSVDLFTQAKKNI